MKILMVCLGNICRSPLAEAILREKADAQNLDIEIDSCGTGNYHIGEPPDERSQANALKNGIDISYLRARQFKVTDFEAFDRIFVMDQSNYNNVAKVSSHPEQMKKVEFILNTLNPGSNESVPDPYFGGESGFQRVFELLDAACDKIVEDLAR
ncbi:MAG: low molecular weight phosphotyrosine protein phosphatase [Cryomorphaceae bacterium]|nr:MAG: low molecular weight phosphotyrosine protein phosphatase [Cryomorphaceae bacterium]